MTDKREFERIFRQHYDGMFRLARRMLGERLRVGASAGMGASAEIDAESKDVVSDVFAYLLKSNIDLKADTLQAFLLTSVRNRCINLLVHKQKEQQMQKAVVVEMMTPERTAEEEQLQMLHHYIDTQMPALSQQILRLRYQQGLKYREIAEVLQVSEVTVHNHLSQSLKELKNHFKALGYGIK